MAFRNSIKNLGRFSSFDITIISILVCSDEHTRNRLKYYEEEKESRSQNKGKKNTRTFFETEESVMSKSTDSTSIMHSGGIYALNTSITSAMTQHSSFPWQTFITFVSALDSSQLRRGKAFLYFPSGELPATYDHTFGDAFNYYWDDVPGLIDLTVRAFTFRKDLRYILIQSNYLLFLLN